MTVHIDEADWTGIKFASVSVGSKGIYCFRGRSYVTPGELAIAQALAIRGIAFTPDVFIQLPSQNPKSSLPFVYVPDFIFNGQPMIWIAPDGTEQLIHGLEIKHRCRDGSFPPKGIRKTGLLYELRKIRVRLLCEHEARLLRPLPIKNLD
ncbi:MAG: hypothetical protein V1738_05445 [Patescibacteria group bacterium]